MERRDKTPRLGSPQDLSEDARAPDADGSDLRARGLQQRWLQRKANSAARATAPSAPLARAAADNGAPVDEDVRRKVEGSTGQSLEGVRVHTSSDSHEAAASVQARAFTVGRDVHFAAGQYRPGSSDGDRLLAHELVHTIQQGMGAPQGQCKLEVSEPGDASEVEADQIADAALDGRAGRVGGSARPSLQRQVHVARDPQPGHEAAPAIGAHEGDGPEGDGHEAQAAQPPMSLDGLQAQFEIPPHLAAEAEADREIANGEQPHAQLRPPFEPDRARSLLRGVFDPGQLRVSGNPGPATGARAGQEPSDGAAQQGHAPPGQTGGAPQGNAPPAQTGGAPQGNAPPAQTGGAQQAAQQGAQQAPPPPQNQENRQGTPGDLIAALYSVPQIHALLDQLVGHAEHMWGTNSTGQNIVLVSAAVPLAVAAAAGFIHLNGSLNIPPNLFGVGGTIVANGHEVMVGLSVDVNWLVRTIDRQLHGGSGNAQGLPPARTHSGAAGGGDEPGSSSPRP